jgi:hypothetical protein
MGHIARKLHDYGMYHYAAHDADGLNLPELRGQAVALINDWRRLIEIWTRIQRQAIEAGNQERADRAAHLITECEISLSQAEDRLRVIQQLMNAEERQTTGSPLLGGTGGDLPPAR